MKKNPDHRLCSVIAAHRAAKKPSGSVEKELYALLSNNTAQPDATSAYDIHSHPYKREVIESFLLVGSTPAEIEDILKVSESITEIYAYLFFDPDVFENELDRISYAYTYTKDPFGYELKKFAVDLGKESLKIRMSRGTYAIPATDVQDGIRSTAYLMGQMVRVNPMDSRAAQASLKWAQLGLRAAAEEDAERDLGGIDKVKFELQEKDETTNAKKSGIEQDEILH